MANINDTGYSIFYCKGKNEERYEYPNIFGIGDPIFTKVVKTDNNENPIYEFDESVIIEALRNDIFGGVGMTVDVDLQSVESFAEKIINKRMHSFKLSREQYLKYILQSTFDIQIPGISNNKFGYIFNSIYNSMRPDFYAIVNKCRKVKINQSLVKSFKDYLSVIKQFVDNEHNIQKSHGLFEAADKLSIASSTLSKYINMSVEDMCKEYSDINSFIKGAEIDEIEDFIKRKYFTLSTLTEGITYKFTINELFSSIPDEYIQEHLYSEYNMLYENEKIPFIVDFCRACDKCCATPDGVAYSHANILNFIITKYRQFCVRNSSTLNEYTEILVPQEENPGYNM